jgi:hypothetical protein
MLPTRPGASVPANPFSPPPPPPPTKLCCVLMHHQTTAPSAGKLRGNAQTVYANLRDAVIKIHELKAHHTNAQLIGTSTLMFTGGARILADAAGGKPFELLKYHETADDGRVWNHFWWVEMVSLVGGQQRSDGVEVGTQTSAQGGEVGYDDESEVWKDALETLTSRDGWAETIFTVS